MTVSCIAFNNCDIDFQNQKSRGVLRRKALSKQKKIDQAKREEREFNKMKSAERDAKISRRSVQKVAASYESCLPKGDLADKMFTNANHAEKIAELEKMLEEAEVEEEEEEEVYIASVPATVAPVVAAPEENEWELL